MSEDMQFHGNITNNTGKPLSKNSDSMDWGSFKTSPPSQIANNTTGSFVAWGAESTMTGTQGSVVYTTFDGTAFTFKWDIPYSGANSGGLTCNDKGSGACSATFTTSASPESFPSDGDSVTVSYTIGLQT